MIDPPSVIVKTFGDTPFIRTLDHFLLFDCWDYSKNWLAKELNISRMTMDKVWEELVKKKIIIKTRTVGRAEMYKTNMQNPTVKELIKFEFKLARMAVEEELGRKEIVSVKV